MYDSKYVYYFIATAIKWIQSDWAIDMAEASYAVWEKKELHKCEYQAADRFNEPTENSKQIVNV